MLTLLWKEYLERAPQHIAKRYEIASNVPAVPAQKRIRVPGCGRREKKGAGEPFFSRGVVE